MFKKPVWDDLSFVTWYIILLDVAIRRWVHCSHKGMDMVGSQNQTVIVGKGSNTQKCWKTKEFVGTEGFFWRTAGSLTVQDKQGTHEQLSLNKKNSIKNQGEPLNGVIFINSTIIFSCELYVNICYVKYIIQVSNK